MKEHPSRFGQPLHHCALAMLAASLLAGAQMTGAANGLMSLAQSEQEIRPLVPGQPVEREIAGGQEHACQIVLAEGQYLKIVVEQRGIDVVAQVLGPDGKPVAEFDLDSRKQGQETVEQVAEAGGLYRLMVRARQKEAPAGRYEIRVVELRAATEKDRALQEARRLNTEFLTLYRAGRYDEALPTAARLLAIREQALGPEHVSVATSLNNLAALHLVKGEFAKAEPLYQRAVAIWEKALGPEHPDVAHPLNNLAIIYGEKGDYTKAESFIQRALAIREKALGAEHPLVAQSLTNLAGIYNEKGDYTKAEPLFQRALTIQEKAGGPEHPGVVPSLNNLAKLYYLKGDYARSEPFRQRALAIQEKSLGPEHPGLALTLNNLANLYFSAGDPAKAESLYLRALAIQEKGLGAEHPDTASTLANLAILHRVRGDYAKAEMLSQRALNIFEKALGPEHPNVANALRDLAALYAAQGKRSQAVTCQVRADAVRERNLALNVAAGSERQKLAYLATLTAASDQTISLHLRLAPDDPAAARLALAVILQRKGRALDTTVDTFGSSRRRASPQDQALFDQLKETGAELARLVLGGPQRMTPAEHRQRIKVLEDQKEDLEARVSRNNHEARAEFQPVTVEAVQAAIPDEAAVVEFFSWRPVDFKSTEAVQARGEPRYAAYILRRQGEPQWVELGEAGKIDEAAGRLRAALRNPKRDDIKQLARALDEMVMQPVRAKLSSTRRVLLSPDGALTLVPFAALADEQDRWLVEGYEFSYLTSGSDLLRLQTTVAARQGPLVVTNPDFGERSATGDERRIEHESPSSSTTAFRRFVFRPLPGTAGEGEALRAILPGAKLLAGSRATETVLKQVSGPAVLHVATHGFFLEDLKTGAAKPGDAAIKVENPLLRSGLALAGANRQTGEDDGILTALEVANLDLWGTRLVVLSACDTGVGEVRTGDGVHGLRRALVLAGSESQVMSLWPVSDKGTRDLMIGYYKGLGAGIGRSAALRGVQLQMLKRKDRQHPYYWASFIESGEWANLEGKR